ncbi:NAD(P)-binding protein, partial [Mycena crocata]
MPQVALVTGAARGVGKGVALRLAKDGFDVAVNDIPMNGELLNSVVDEVKSMIEEVVRVHAGLDVMANAGVCKWASIANTSVDEWDRVMAINARKTFLCYKYAGMQMVAQGRGGRIIGASSISGKKSGALTSAYCASKFAVRGLTQSAAMEYGRHGIIYAPGTTDTEMLHYLNPTPKPPMGAPERLPSSTPDDIAAFVSYIASKESQFITAQGIGKAIALRLAEDGFDVAVNDISNTSEALNQLVEEIKGKGRTSSAHLADVALDDQVRGMIEEVVNVYGQLNVMVANAGVGVPMPLSEMNADQWDRVMGINARGVFLCYKYAGMQMIKQGKGGRIIGASSIIGKQGMALNFAYTASKFAVRGLTQSAAIEFGAHGITVNAYAPGAINTGMLKSIATATQTPWEMMLDTFKKSSPLGIVGVPEDVANIVSFIASKESSFITGQSVSNLQHCGMLLTI